MSRDKGISEVNCVGRRGLNTGVGRGLGKPPCLEEEMVGGEQTHS